MKFLSKLQHELRKPLPGKEVQYLMAHNVRKVNLDFYKTQGDVRLAGVLALIYPKDQELYITLMKRTDIGPHSGQISFPGGGIEDHDDDLKQTALREAQEEVGIIPDQVEIIGSLSDLYIPVSQSLVHPFVGFSPNAPTYRIDPNEVKFVIEAPLSGLIDKQNSKFTDIKLNNNLTLKEVPYFDVDGHVVWGATAMILKELLVIIENVQSGTQSI